jgi:aspartate/methionine/tyrosine aminotransferase
MKYRRMPIEIESPEQLGYETIQCNLAESSVSDISLSELGIKLDHLVLAYGDHLGKPELRACIAKKYSGISADDVLVTPGAANALFIISTSLLERHDRLIVQFPNYATNLETPFAIGCDVAQVELTFDNEFRMDIGSVQAKINSHTRLISVTTPHNPTGTALNRAELDSLISLAEANNGYLLVDETYRDLSLDGSEELPPLAASLSDRVISVSSLSKASGLPGIRIGWIMTKNKELQEIFLAAKEQIVLCNSVIDEEIAFAYLQQEYRMLPHVIKQVGEKAATVFNWLQSHDYLEFVKPTGGVVCFPRFKNSVKIDAEKFHSVLFNEYKTLVGRGAWFGMSDRYMRIGFGWPSLTELKDGLNNIDQAIKQAILP